MNVSLLSKKLLSTMMALCFVLGAQSAYANGKIGDHVNHLSDNLGKYEEEVSWIIKKVDGIVDRYESDGVKAAHASAVVDHWEAVDFHAAIESNFIQLYANIWQGLYGVKEAIDNKQPVAKVREEQYKLEQTLWQSLGAVKLAAQYQNRGLLAQVQLREGAPSNSLETLDAIKTHLNKAVAKFAEKATDESTNIVHETYLNLFEGVEGELIALDANLVEDLEKDFNVTLPKAIKGKSTLDQVRQVVVTMETKLDKAIALLKTKEQNKKKVF